LKTFEYKGFDSAGKSCKGLVEAVSLKEARENLVHDGILAERVVVTGRKVAFSAEKRAMVYRELSALLGAGVPLVKALDTLIQSPELGESRSLMAGVRDSVREGASLARALSNASNSVTAFERAIIEAAEKTATVEMMLERLASFIEEQERLRERVQGALIYPSIVVTVGICVAIVMLGLLVPRARDILSGSNIPLPRLTVFMIGLGRFLMIFGLPLLAVLAAVAVRFRQRMKSDLDFRRHWDEKLFGMPVIGKGYAILVNLRFSRTLAILIHGGVALIDALILAGRATGSSWVTQLAEAQAESVRHGSTLSDAVRKMPPLATSLPAWIQTGEASGDLERLLNSAAQRYQEQWDRYINRCLSFLEPIMILVIGGFVLMVTISVLLPVLSLTKAVGR
jgi:general secretion pathway protein F